MIMIMKVMGNKRTVRRPIASGDHTVYTLLRADLLAKRRDAGVSDESGIERIHAFPRRISCMGAAKKKVLTDVRNTPLRGFVERGRRRILALACRLPRDDTCRASV